MNQIRTPKSARAIVLAAVSALAASGTAHAADLYWLGGTGDLFAPNYYDPATNTSGVTPSDTTDYLSVGADGQTTVSGTQNVLRLRLGHADAVGPSGSSLAGTGTLSVTGSLNISYTTAAPAAADAGLYVGTGATGVLNVNGGTVTVQETAAVGYGADPSVTGTLNVSNNGTFQVNNGTLWVGALGGNTLTQSGGVVNVNNGNLKVTGSGGDMVIGYWNSSTFTQTGGSTVVDDRTSVGRGNADNSSFTLSGGTFQTGEFWVGQGTVAQGRSNDVTVSVTNATLNSAGQITVGADASGRGKFSAGSGAVVTSGSVNIGTDSAFDSTLDMTGNASLTTGTVNIGSNNSVRPGWTLSGTATASTGAVNIGRTTASRATWTLNNDAAVSSGTIVVGANATSNASLNLNDNASLTSSGTITVGSGTSTGAKLNVAGGTMSSTGNIWVGRDDATGVTFTMTGGTITAGSYFLLGNGANALNGTKAVVLANHSGGKISTGEFNVTLGDYEADVTYNLSGTAEIDSAYSVIVGRRIGTSVLNQTGGTVTAARGVRIGDQQPNDTAPLDLARSADGTYQISAGTLNANTDGPTRDALSIGDAGTGAFRVVGQDAVINVNGNISVDSSIAGNGALAYRLEAGDSGLSTINSTGTATFSAGSVLQLDFNAVEPVQGVYNALTAADVINNGLVASIPAGWNYQIVPSTGGKTLRFIAGDFNADAVINADDLVWIDRGRAMNLTGGANGDLNGDGTIDAEDYQLIDQAYAANNTLSPGFLAARASEFGNAYVSRLVAAVPEPSSLLAAGALILPALTRRRRRTT